ncbi:MAG TPA: DUF222 domain-containing protein [Streptosporangiaceae bacterium]
MRRKQVPGPGPDGEEQDSSPSSFSGPGGFADGGPADVLVPGAQLAGTLAAVTGTDGTALRVLSDQEVLGVIAAGGRMAAWAAWVQTVGLAEFARRRPGVMSGSTAAREAAEEASWKTAETWTRMLDQMTRAVTMTSRLPHTLAAMGQGRVSEYKARIIDGQTADLSADDVAKADVLLAAAGQVKNPAGLRDFARRQIMRLDPGAAERRKERERQDAHVRIWQEDSGNAGLSVRQAPAADAVIAWQNIERRAMDLHAAGAEGTAGQLQVQAALDFLLGRATPGQGARESTHAASGSESESSSGSGSESGSGSGSESGSESGSGACQDAHRGGQGGGRGDRRGGGRGGWVVNPVLVVPWDPGLGRPSGPAELPGFGLLDENDTMDLLAAAADNPATRWCLTTTDKRDGTATAHGCVSGRRTLKTIADADTAADLAARLGVQLTPITKGACQHAHAEPGYTPSRKLRHLIQARNNRCAAPECGRPAAACDLDHTRPWEDGGPSCACNLAPLCRVHHQVKQAQGWKIEQPEPGVLAWTSPSGLTRTIMPSSYQD